MYFHYCTFRPLRGSYRCGVYHYRTEAFPAKIFLQLSNIPDYYTNNEVYIILRGCVPTYWVESDGVLIIITVKVDRFLREII